MNRFLIFLFLIILTGSLYAIPLKRINDHIYMVQGYTGLPSKENRGFISNAYGIVTEKGWIVIDSLSTPSLAKEFIQELKRIKNLPVKYLIITHYHLDHYFGSFAFKTEGAKIIAHKNLLKLYNSGYLDTYLENLNKIFDGLFKSVNLTEPDITVEDRYQLKIGNTDIRILSMTPAHTNTDIVVYLPQDKIVFVGDLVFKNRIPFAADSFSDSKNWLNVLSALKNLDIEVILNGHNRPLDKSAIDFTYEYLSFLRKEISKMKDEDLPYDEIKERLQSVKWKKYPMFKEFHNKNIYKIYIDLDFEF